MKVLSVDNTLLAVQKVLEKVPSVCFLKNHNVVVLINYNFNKKIVKDVEIWFPRNFMMDTLNCIKNKKSNFMFLNILLKNKSGGHGNCLIFKYKNKNTIEIERYEPLGTNVFYNVVDSYLKKILATLFKEYDINIVYYTPLNFCPIIGAQKHAKDNQLCVIFSAIYIYDRLINPKLSRKKIANLYTKTDGKILLKQIKDFKKFLISKIENVDMKIQKSQFLFKDYDIFSC